MKRPNWKTIRTHSKRWIKVLAWTLCAIFLAQMLLLPWIVRRVVTSALRSLGIENVAFDVRGVSLFRADLADLAVGQERLAEVGNITADFSPATLLRGRVKNIAITGAELELSFRDGRLDFGAIKLGQGTGSIPTASTGLKADLPFSRLELRASTLAVQLEHRRLNVPVAGQVVNHPDRSATFELEARLQGAPINLSGTIGPASGQYSINAASKSLSARALLSLLPRDIAENLPSIAGGTLAVDLSHSAGGDAHGTSLHLVGSQLNLDYELAGQRLSADDLQAVLDARWNAGFELASLTLDGQIARLWLGRESFPSIKLAARKTGQTFSIELNGPQLSGEATYALNSRELNLTAAINDFEARRLLSFIPPENAGAAPVIRAGKLAARISHQSTSLTAKTEIALSGADLALDYAGQGHHLSTSGLAFDVAALFEGAPDPDRLKLNLSAGRLTVDDEAIQNLSLSIERKQSGLSLSASASGNDWAIRKLDGTFTGVFPVYKAPIPDRREIEATFTVSADGRLPADVVRTLFSHRINATRVGTFSINGSINASAIFELPLVAYPGEPLPINWKIASDSLRLALSPGDLSLNRGEVDLRGLSADIPLSLDANADRLTIALQPSAQIQLASIVLRDQPLRIQAPAGASLAMLQVGPKSASIAFSPTDAASTWRIELPSLIAHLNAHTLESPEAWHVQDLIATFNLHGMVEPNQILLHAGEGSTFKFVKATSGSAHVTGAAFSITPFTNEALFLAMPGLQPTLAANVTSASPLEINTKNFSAKIPQIGLSGLFVPGTLQSTLSISEAAFTSAQHQLTAPQISATIPISFNAGGIGAGQIATGAIELRDAKYPPIKGNLALRDGQAIGHLEWPILENLASLAVDARLNFADQTGHATATIPSFSITDEKAVARLIPALEGIDLAGQFSARADIQFRENRLTPKIEITAKNATIGSKEYVRAIEGLSANIQINSLSPFTTPGAQRIDIAAATLGKLKFSDGRIHFRVEPDGRLHIEETSWGLGGGRIYTNSFRFDPARPRLDLAVTADRIGLQGFLPAVSDETITGEGTVYGRIPVSIDWPLDARNKTVEWSEPQIAFGEGFIYATPGGGRLAVGNPEELLGDRLEQQDKRFSRGGEFEPIKQRLMTALRDLNYSILRLDLTKGEAGSLTARLHLAGKARQGGPNAPEIGGVTININHFDEVLKRAVWIQKRLSIGK